MFSRLTYGSLALRPVALLALLVGADRILIQPTRTFTSGLPTVWSPAPSPDITTVPTGQLALAGLPPARSSIRFTALYGQSLPDLIVVSGELLETATTILHSEGGDCKKLLLDPTTYLAKPSRDRASGGTPVRQLERKEKMRPIDGPRVLHPRVNLK